MRGSCPLDAAGRALVERAPSASAGAEPLRVVAGWLAAACLSLCACGSGCTAFFPEAAERPALGVSPRNQGFSLLYEFLSKEKDVDKLLLIKSETPEVQSIIKKIAAASANAATKLAEFAREDSTIDLEVQSLPEMEQETRAAIESAKAKTLLFSKGPRFEVLLLVAQAEGLAYGGYLAEVLSGVEESPEKKEYLAGLSSELLRLYEDVLGILDDRRMARARTEGED
jgi:hypothetical protein